MRLHVETRGSGPPLVLLHGWGMNSEVWSGLLPTLAQRFRVSCVDLPGHGASRSASGSHGLAEMVASVTEVAPRGAAWLGWSLGGQVALAVARSSADVRQLILVATTPKFLAGPGWAFGMAPATLAGFAAKLEGDYRKALRDFLVLQLRGSRHAEVTSGQLYRLLAARGEPDPAALASGLRVLAETDLRPWVPQVAQPVLVIGGESDRVTPPGAGRWLASQLKEARYVSMAGAAHAPFLASPTEFCDAITTFLQNEKAQA